MKHHSSSSKDQFFKKEIPLTSQETYNKLTSGATLKDISTIVYNFKLLVDKERSVLTSHHQRENPLDNQEFINDLDVIMGRLTEAVTNKQPYTYLFGDFLRLKEYLQVILGYYQNQLDKNFLDVRHYDAEISKPSSSFAKLIASIARGEKSLLNDEESREFEKYGLTHSGIQEYMEHDIKRISSIVLQSFLEDHSNDKSFTYC